MLTFQKPSLFFGKIIDKNILNSKIIKIKIRLSRSMIFYAGQFISLRVSGTTYRSYSIASSPLNDRVIELIISVAHDGIGSNYIRNCKKGDDVNLIGPSGRFIIPENLSRKLIFIATGTGIAPFLSMFEVLYTMNNPLEISLLFGVRSTQELFAQQELLGFSKKFKKFDYKICYSRESLLPDSNSYLGRVTNYIKHDNEADYFICGNPNMVSEVCNKLQTSGIERSKIFTESFTYAKSN